MTPLVVQRRLKLANISPRLMADYRADAVNLDQLTALAITDDHAALLGRLAQDKLAEIAEEVRGEGWAWVEATPAATYADLQSFQRAPQEKRQPNAREAKRIAKLNAKAQAVETALQAAIDAEDEDKADTLHDEGYRLSEQLADLDGELAIYSPTVRAARK